MKLFFGEINNGIVTINDEEQQHIVKVLRMKNGEEIHVTDGNGNLASGKLVIEGKKANIEVSEIKKGFPDFSPKLHIAIAPTKNIDRIEFFVEIICRNLEDQDKYYQRCNIEKRWKE